MDLLLQFGYGMINHSEELIKQWGKGNIILSPRDMSLKQMIKLSKNILKHSGKCLLDPQFYLPRCNHEKLISHAFWPEDYDTTNFFQSDGIFDMLKILYNEYNLKIETSHFILPGLYSESINDDWKRIHDLIIDTSEKINVTIPKLATLCLSSEVLLNEDLTHDIIDHIEDWNVDGFYLIPEHPNNNYLVDNPVWLLNLLDICAALKLNNKKVIVGYCSHQEILLALSKIDAIATGTWINVRMFPKDKFYTPEDESISRRSTWYYCPQAMSEYQVAFLGIAYKSGILNELKSDNFYNSNYANILFQGSDPTTVNFSEREAFRHYLQCLKIQVLEAEKDTYDDTLNSLKLKYQTAQDLTEYFISCGVRGKYRDFSNVVDSSISVLDAFTRIRGLIYKQKWNDI